MIKRLYIAYGSNLNTEQMAYRCPDARPLGKSILKDYKLLFRGTLRSYGVANVEPCEGSTVPVGVWSISDEDEHNLDIYEGYPTLYYKDYVEVELDGVVVSGLIYMMQPGHEIGVPSFKYEETILEGYRDFGIDPEPLDMAIEECAEIVRLENLR